MRTDPNALATFAAILEEVGRRDPQRQARILDAGCGQGQLLGLLHRQGHRTLTGVGYDIAVPEGASAVPGVDLSLPGWHARAGGSQDILIATDVIEHLLNPFQFLLEMRALAAPGASLLLTFPNVHNLRSRIGYAVSGRPSGFFGPNLSEKPIFDQHVWMPNDHIVDYFLGQTGFRLEGRCYIHGRGRLFTQTAMVMAVATDRAGGS